MLNVKGGETMELLLGFLAGAFLANGVPHFVSGVKGRMHMTPLAKDSSAIVNVIWGVINFIIGLWLLNYSQMTLQQALSFSSFSWSFLLGVFVMGLSDAWLFSKKGARFPWFK